MKSFNALFKAVSCRWQSHKRLSVAFSAASVFFVTIGIRFLFIIDSKSIPAIRTPTPGMDIDLHWQAGRMLLKGADPIQPCFELMMCSAPLHPYWLAFWQHIIGSDQIIHRYLNAGITSISSVFIFLTIRQLTQRTWIAFVSGLLWATLPSIVFFDATLYKAGLELLTLAILVKVMISYKDHGTDIYFAIIGFCAAILVMILYFFQTATFLYAFVIGIYFLIDQRLTIKKRCVLLAALIITCLFIIVPYQYRKQLYDMKYSWWQPLKGIHFNIGYTPKADGTYVKLSRIPTWPYGHLFYAKMVAEVTLGRTLTPAECDAFFIQRGKAFILDNPWDAFRLVLKKVMLFFNNYEVKGVDNLYYLKHRSRILALLPFGLGVLVMFAGLGFLYLLKMKKNRTAFLLVGLLLAILSSNIIIFISWRYRLQSVVPLILLTAFGMAAVQHYICMIFRDTSPFKEKLFKFLLMIVVPMVICGWISYHPVIGQKSRQFDRASKINARISRDSERLTAALLHLESKQSTGTHEMIKKALLLKKLHRHSEAYQLSKQIIAKEIYHPEVVYNYVLYLMWLGEYGSAAETAKTVMQRNMQVYRAFKRKLKGIEKEAYYRFVAKRAEIS